MRNQDIINWLLSTQFKGDEFIQIKQKIIDKNNFYLESYYEGGSLNFIQLSRKSDKIESRLQNNAEEALEALGLKFEAEACIKNYYVDFLVENDIIVEVMGPIHFLAGNQMVKRDQFKLEYLKSFGYKVVVLRWDDLPPHLDQRCEILKRKLEIK